MMHVLVGHNRMAEQQLLGHGVSSLVGDPKGPHPSVPDPSVPEVAGGTQIVPGRPDHRSVRWMSTTRLRLGHAYLLVGWSEPDNQARAVTPGERPEDPPARGDCHPARLGDWHRPQMYLLAEARRPPSVHPADLRSPLSGVPHPRAAVLQPRRLAVPGARHRAAGGRAGSAVAGKGDDERRHRPIRSQPRR
jgi:hypothetical protein